MTLENAWRTTKSLTAMIAACMVALTAGHAADTDNLRAKRIAAAFTDWAARNGVKEGAIAVTESGKITGGAGVGGTAPSDPEPVASLSKAVTGMCVLKLVEAGKIHFSDTLGTLLPDYFAAHPPADPAAKKITVAALLTHTSGLGVDPTQGAPLLQFKPFTQPAAEKELTAALSVPLKKNAGYAYNNVNYAALGFIIATVTGKPYDTYCAGTVLKPVGITDATLNPDWRVMGAFGAWKLSAEDVARFLANYESTTIPADQWPQAALGGGASYSIGTLMRQADSGYNFWHFGSWVWTGSPKASFGAYFASLASGIGYAANYRPTVSDAAMSDLDERLWKAASGP